MLHIVVFDAAIGKCCSATLWVCGYPAGTRLPGREEELSANVPVVPGTLTGDG